MSHGNHTPEIRINQPLPPVKPPEPGDRVGAPLGVELKSAGRPDDGHTEAKPDKYTLTDMAKDIEFFTTALICVAGRFDRDPVVEFMRHNPSDNPDLLPFAIDHQYPFFNGIGVGLAAGQVVDWDRRLYGIHRDRWTQCRDFIGGILVYHRPSKFYARMMFNEIEIVDQFKLKQTTIVNKLPTVPITVFGVSSTHSFVYLEPREYPKLPHVKSLPPRPNIRHEAVAAGKL